MYGEIGESSNYDYPDETAVRTYSTAIPHSSIYDWATEPQTVSPF